MTRYIHLTECTIDDFRISRKVFLEFNRGMVFTTGASWIKFYCKGQTFVLDVNKRYFK